ncbi:MAG: shikimate dehydrogenase [Rhodospirillales bacterium]|nr:shikimate dehydrogenase [Rhodospirillales bacterium]
MTDRIPIKAGVMGWPVGHSLSPRLHGYWLKQYGINGTYQAIAVRPEDLGDALNNLKRDDFAGVNLTVPHKEAALAHMDEVTDAARRIGAVNTVVLTPEGGLAGSNTDGFGFMENLKAALSSRRVSWRVDSGPAVVVGAGGAARAIVCALVDAGVGELRLINRSEGRARDLAKAIGGPFDVIPWAGRESALAGAALLVNTTTLGMTGQPPLDLSLAALPETAVVNDIVYAPLETPLLAAARARGNPVVDGLGMLLHQARPGFAAWFGIEPEVTEDLRAWVLKGMAGAAEDTE